MRCCRGGGAGERLRGRGTVVEVERGSSWDRERERERGTGRGDGGEGEARVEKGSGVGVGSASEHTRNWDAQASQEAPAASESVQGDSFLMGPLARLRAALEQSQSVLKERIDSRGSRFAREGIDAYGTGADGKATEAEAGAGAGLGSRQGPEHKGGGAAATSTEQSTADASPVQLLPTQLPSPAPSVRGAPSPHPSTSLAPHPQASQSGTAQGGSSQIGWPQAPPTPAVAPAPRPAAGSAAQALPRPSPTAKPALRDSPLGPKTGVEEGMGGQERPRRSGRSLRQRVVALEELLLSTRSALQEGRAKLDFHQGEVQKVMGQHLCCLRCTTVTVS